MITIVHAPSVNFVTMITMSTMNESTAAVPLMMARRRHCGSFVRRWYFTMPAPAMVKPVNTPMAYSGIRWSTWALVTRSSKMATTVRR